MASAANSLRLCLRAAAVLRRPAATATTTPLRTPLPLLLRLSNSNNTNSRPLSTTRTLRETANNNDDANNNNNNTEPQEHDEEEEGMLEEDYANVAEALRAMIANRELSDSETSEAEEMLARWDAMPTEARQTIADSERYVSGQLAALAREPPIKKILRSAFWNEFREDDPMTMTDEVGEDDFEEDDMMSMGHAKLEEHREWREYARVAVWEMPLLAKFAKEFEPPADEEILRFRYTTYMGEFHPADRKVVVEFCPKDVPGLTEVQRRKLIKLAGARYNPEKETVKMSCERFDHQAQNKRYLGDLVDKMIAMAKDPTDTFEDVPLDTRHHFAKTKPRFPKEWRLSEARKQELEGIRRQALLLDVEKKKAGQLVDGNAAIEQARMAPLEPVMERLGAAKRRGFPLRR